MKIAALALGVALVPALAWASPPAPRARRSPAPAVRPAKERSPLPVQVARVVFPREHWQKLVRDASTELTERLTASAQGQYELAPEFADRLREEYEKLAPYEELVAYQARILGHEYTRAELRQLLRFYGSPLGIRSLGLLQELTQVSHLQMQAKVRDGMETALNKLVTLVRPVQRPEAAPAPQAAPAPEGAPQDGAAEAPDLSSSDDDEKAL